MPAPLEPSPEAFRFPELDRLGPLPAASVPDHLRMGALAGASYVRRRRFSRWQARHPGARFADYYVAEIDGKLARGEAHRTLGRSRWAESKREGQERVLALLRHWGLKPWSSCIEYGCGSLRIGQHLVRFLAPGRYLGLDVSDRFFAAGFELLGDEVVRSKAPSLQVLDPDLLAELARSQPDFLVSIAVLHHVHPRELDEFLGNLLGLVGPDTQAFVTFREWHRTVQTAEKSWSHAARDLDARMRRIDPGVEVRVRRMRKLHRDPSWKSMLRITRRPR